MNIFSVCGLLNRYVFDDPKYLYIEEKMFEKLQIFVQKCKNI